MNNKELRINGECKLIVKNNQQMVNREELKMGNHKNKKSNNSKSMVYVVIGAALVAVIAGSLFFKKEGNKNEGKAKENVVVLEGKGLVIPINEITNEASYYPVEVDGVGLEVLAIKATDGTIRTAFNTCQICYSSGRGYYEQDGDVLVCQNCKNRFSPDEVEVTRGGCNPVPIFSEDKTVDDTNITISNAFLKEATGIFENWKEAY